jgi:hypothetical protein
MLLTTALALTCALPAEAAKRKVPRGFYGVMWNRAGTDVPKSLHDQQFTRMARSGVESLRTVFSWAGAQRVAGEPVDFGATDHVLTLAAPRHIDVLPVVIYTPTWAALHPSVFASPPARASDYAAYLTALVGRYGPKGTFWTEHPELPKRPIRHWQIWNEPNFLAYWYEAPGKSWVPGYAKLLKASYAAVKAADPGATVITAGLSNFPWDYLASIYRAGAKNSFDAVAVNPFTTYLPNVIRIVRKTRAFLRKRGQRRKPVWITELTWPASKGQAPGRERLKWERRWETTPRGMARQLSEVYRLVAKMRRRERIARLYWYTWATSYKGDDLFDYDGLLRWDGFEFASTPALVAYTKSARAHQGCIKTAAGVCER